MACKLKLRGPIEKLRRDAARACRFRGHVMRWSVWHGEAGRNHPFGDCYGACVRCGMLVSCDTKPMPNESDIGGEAVALTCTGPVRKLVENKRIDTKYSLDGTAKDWNQNSVLLELAQIMAVRGIGGRIK